MWRDESLALILETVFAPGAKPAVAQPADGMARYTTEHASLADDVGREVVLSGVLTQKIVEAPPGMFQEAAGVHEVTVTVTEAPNAAFVIEWLENLPASPFIWPHTITTTQGGDMGATIELSEHGLSIHAPDLVDGLFVSALRLTIDGTTFYVCADQGAGGDRRLRSGCIVYKGTPDELFRKKVRTALGFVLGVYLVETGHTSYDSHWRFVGGTARSAYSLSGRAFDLAPMPLAHLSDRNFQHDLGPEKTARMVGALFASFGTLDLGNLSWAYWHARCATVHIAPAQYGAAIEGLLRAFEKHQAGRGRTTILDRAAWVRVSRAIAMTIAAADTAESAKLAMGKNLARLNEPAKRVALADALQTMGIDIGPDEAKAWRRRNLAAHGMPIEEGQELAAIRDMKLLKGLFHRMLLSASKAAETYIDYASPFFPIRPLKDPPHTSHGI